MKKKKLIAIRVREYDYEKICEIADKKQYYPSELIRKIIEDYVNNYSL